MRVFKMLLTFFGLLFLLYSCNNSAPKSEGRILNEETVTSKVSSDAKDDQSEIISISTTRSAGRGGSTTISATPDSIIFEPGTRMIEEGKGFRKKINPADWKKLISGLDVTVLNEMKSGESRAPYDGPDFRFQIMTQEKEYQLVNVENETHNEQLNAAEKILKSIVSKEK